jgi:hypothetical protein
MGEGKGAEIEMGRWGEEIVTQHSKIEITPADKQV